jgi:PRTRC genetic system protein A
VQIWLAEASVRGLSPADEFFKFDYPPVPSDIINEMVEQARNAEDTNGQPIEILFYLIWDSNPVYGEWKLVTPEQHQSAAACRPTNTTDPDYQRCIIEVHSHHGMKAFFSGQDDKDETGFKIYAVLGEIFNKPTILVRCGLYGYFTFVPASQVFVLPEWLEDGAWPQMDFTEIEEEETSAAKKLAQLEEGFQWLADAVTEDRRYWPSLEFSNLEGEGVHIQAQVIDGDDAYNPKTLSIIGVAKNKTITETVVETIEGAKPVWAKKFMKVVK